MPEQMDNVAMGTGAGEAGTETAGSDFVIPGLPFKSAEEVAKGFKYLETKLGEQGTKLGQYESQLKQATSLLEKAMAGQQTKAPTQSTSTETDYDTKLNEIDSKIGSLDIDDPGYHKELAKLTRQSQALVAKKVQTETEQRLMGHFEKALSERDANQSQQQWKVQNPDFDTPEMQQAIQQKLSQDKTGMLDPVLAYREIQLQQIQARAQQLEQENADYQARLKLKSGEQAVGKVVTKTGGSQVATKQPKLTGEALKQGALEAFRNAS